MTPAPREGAGWRVRRDPGNGADGRTGGARPRAHGRAPDRLPPPGPRAPPPVASPPPGCAHKDPDLRNTRRTQGLDSAPVCDAVLPNSGPCVRHREGRAVTGHAPRPAGPEGGGCADARYRHRRALLAPTRVVRTSARYIPLAVSTTPSRCRQPPRGVNNPLAMSTTPSRCRQPPRGVNNPLAVSTTPSRCRQRASAHRARSPPSPSGGAPETASQATAGYRVERPAFSNPKSMLTDFLHSMLFSNG